MTTQELAEKYVEEMWNDKSHPNYPYETEFGRIPLRIKPTIVKMVAKVITTIREQAMKEQREKVEIAFIDGFLRAVRLVEDYGKEEGLISVAKKYFDEKYPAIRKEE